MIRRPPRSTHCISSAASDVYKRQHLLLTGLSSLLTSKYYQLPTNYSTLTAAPTTLSSHTHTYCSLHAATNVPHPEVHCSPVQCMAAHQHHTAPHSTTQHHTLKTTTLHSEAQGCPQATNFFREKPQCHDGVAKHCGFSPRWHSTCAAQLHSAVVLQATPQHCCK